MTLILTVVHVLACVALVFIVLLQKSAGDMGAAFGGSSQSLFGARGSGSFLGKLTAVLATTFMLTSLALAFLSTQQGRSTSIMEGKANKEASAPAAPAKSEVPSPPKAVPVPAAEQPAATGTKPIPLPDAAPKSEAPAKKETDSKAEKSKP
ncbi:MAG: preprotein translocase subunit SecG [Magnetococcales bacterium]|nr:preprotein translocase subunit SecG [Magnetococcales bacterium]NGZ26372.1 preprotein translocase subunit SecG [Magnetococcales bacterium]